MIPWRQLDSAQVPGGEGELRLYARGEEFSIRVAAQAEALAVAVAGRQGWRARHVTGSEDLAG